MKIKSIKDILNKSSRVFSLRIISIISGFYLMYLITNIFGAEGMGIFALSQTILMVMVMLSVFGTDTASLKYSSQYFSNNDYSKLNSFADIHGLNHYKKATEFLEIYYLLNNTNTDYIEKKFLNLIYKNIKLQYSK